MSKKILVIGGVSMDLSMNMYKVPSAGESIVDDGGVAYVPSGRGATSAIAFSRLDAEAVFCAKIGVDFHGKTLYTFYKDMGVNTTYVKADPANPTGLTVVMRESDGSTRTVVYPGANYNLTADNVAEAFASMPDAVYIGFEVPFSVVYAAAKLAADRGIPVFVDAAPADKDYPLDTLPPVEIFSPNEQETLEYTGILPQGADSSLRAALALYKRVKCKYLVIKQGSRGAFIYDGRHYSFVPSVRAGDTVDTTAAGDAFTAAMTVKYLESGGDISIAVKYGVAAGAITVSRRGASSALPTRTEIEALIYKSSI